MPVPEGRLLVVDGEEFFVHPSDDGDATHCDWRSGPNPGYGFTIGLPTVFVPEGTAVPAPTRLSEAQVVDRVRGFLSRIDPETGYLDQRVC